MEEQFKTSCYDVSLNIYIPTGRVSKESFLMEILKNYISPKDESEYVLLTKKIIKEMVDSFFELSQLSCLNLDKAIYLRPLWKSVFFQVSYEFKKLDCELCYLQQKKLEYINELLVQFKLLGVRNDNKKIVLESIAEDLDNITSLKEFIKKIYSCKQNKKDSVNQLYQENLKLKPHDIKDEDKFKHYCWTTIIILGNEYFNCEFMSYFSLFQKKTKKEVVSILSNIFDSWLSNYVIELSKSYYEKLKKKYDSLTKKSPQLLDKENLNEILDSCKKDLEQVSTLVEFIVEVYHCEETYNVFEQGLETDLNFLENKGEDKLTMMKRRRDKKKLKSIGSKKLSSSSSNLFESEEAFKELMEYEISKEKKSISLKQKKEKKRKKKNKEKEEKRLFECMSKWKCLSYRFFSKNFRQKLFTDRKEVLQNIKKKNFEASIVIQKNYRKIYNSKKWSKIQSGVNIIQQRIRIFLSQQKRLYLQKILPVKQIIKKYMKPRNILKRFFQIFNDNLSTYYKGFSIGERVILVESTRIQEREHKIVGIIDSINSKRIIENKNPIFVTGMAGCGGIYQSNKTLCRVLPPTN